jgi:hypothetical protein
MVAWKRKASLGCVIVVALIGWDLYSHQVSTVFVGRAISAQLAQDEPLQMDNLPVLRPGTLTLGEGNPTVALAASIDESLSQPAPLDVSLSSAQVDAVVRRALDLDQSGRSLRDVIGADDWVLLKVNSVTNRGNLQSSYYHNNFEHPGQITDLRVVKSTIQYLIEHVGPRRITIAEGGADSPRKGSPGFPSNATEDSWSVTYPEFDDLSYLKILEEFAAMDISTVVDTADLNDAPFRREPIPGGPIQRLGVVRLRYTGAQFGFHVAGTGSFRPEGFYMPEPLLDADKVVSMAAMKTTIYGTTLGIKNYVGTLASRAYGDGTSKAQHYQNNPEHGYVDLFSYNPAAYTIIEGFWGTEGNGPQTGLNVQHNVVVVGADPVATEATANVVMGFNPLDLEALYLAAAKGFGTLDRNKIEVVGRPPESVQRNFIKSKGGGGNGAFYGRGIRRWLVAGPFVGGDEIDQPGPLADEENVIPREGDGSGDLIWQKVEHLGYSAEVLDLGAINGEEKNIINYAFTLVHSDREQEGFLWLGYDERIKVWLNDEVAFERNRLARFGLAQRKVPIRLQQGENRLLFKIGNFNGETVMAAHVVDEDGDRLPGIEFLLPGEVNTAIVELADAGVLPTTAELIGNYPNPFNPSTHLRFALPQAAAVRLDIYDGLGQRIRTLVDGQLAGGYQTVWDGRNRAGFNAASGVYYARLQVGDFQQTKALALIR